MEDETRIRLVEKALFRKWDRDDGVLSIFFMFPSSEEENGQVEFMVNAKNGTVNSTWEYKIVLNGKDDCIQFIDITTHEIKDYIIVGLDKDKYLKLHSTDGYDLSFHPAEH